MNYFDDLSSMYQGLSSGGSWGSGPGGPQAAAGGISGTVGLAGIGLGIAGAMETSSAQSAAYKASANVSALDMQVNNQRQQQMVLQSNRQQMQNLRNVQQTRAAGLSASVSSGAQFGSGLAGAQASETDTGAYNSLNISQNEQIGNQIFALDNQIDVQKIAMANDQSKAAAGQGLSSIGSSLVSGAGSLGMLLA